MYEVFGSRERDLGLDESCDAEERRRERGDRRGPYISYCKMAAIEMNTIELLSLWLMSESKALLLQ